jgi:transposase
MIHDSSRYFLVGTIVESLIVEGPRKRRPNFPVAFKRQLAQQASVPGVSVSQLAQQHGINVNMLFKWRRHLVAGLFDAAPAPQAMLPVAIVETAAAVAPASTPLLPGKAQTASTAGQCTERQGLIEVAIADVTVRFDGHADLSMLHAVLRMLRA